MDFPALEADFQRYYGMDLASALWGPARVGVRKLRNLILYLPDGAAVKRGREGERWSITDHLLASLIEVEHAGIAVAVKAAGGKKKVKPLEVPRPQPRSFGDHPPKKHRKSAPKRHASFEEMAGMFNATLVVNGETNG